jgi:hypothetical protein
MKKISKENSKEPKLNSSRLDKARLVSAATRVTLEQYAKTFKDLARYDREEKITR